jgi:methanogenic corrinoid protein MtbC1
VKGDIHDIGKNIVIALIRVNGFEVFDVGKDVDSTTFIQKAKEVGAEIIGLSGLLTTSLPMMAEVVEMMEEYQVRDFFKVIIGGGPTSLEFAQEIGADYYAENAQSGVLFCEEVFSENSS